MSQFLRVMIADLIALTVIEHLREWDRIEAAKNEPKFVVRLKSKRGGLKDAPAYWESFVHDAKHDPVHGWGVAYGGKADALALSYVDALELAFDLSDSMALWGRLDVVAV